jgi:hypothetical protein
MQEGTLVETLFEEENVVIARRRRKGLGGHLKTGQ